MVVAVGEDINRQELEGIASDPKDENIFTVDTIRDLPSLERNIIFSICDGQFNQSASKLPLLLSRYLEALISHHISLGLMYFQI